MPTPDFILELRERIGYVPQKGYLFSGTYLTRSGHICHQMTQIRPTLDTSTPAGLPSSGLFCSRMRGVDRK